MPARVKLAKSPRPGQQRWSHAKGNHIRQRIQFPPEIAGRARHAGDAAIQSIKQNSEPDCFCGSIEMTGIGKTSVKDLQDGVESQPDVRSREQRRQDVHAFGQPPRTLSCPAWVSPELRGHPSMCTLFLASSASHGEFFGIEISQHAGAALHDVSNFDLHFGVGIEQYIHTRTKLD